MAHEESSKKKQETKVKKDRAVRTNDDLELLKMILDGDRLLRQRVMRRIEKQLGRERLAAGKSPAKDSN